MNINQPLSMTAVQANGLQNATEAIERACVAVSGLVDALHADCFMDSLEGLLGAGAVTDYDVPHEQLVRAYQWLFTNYTRLSAEVDAVSALAAIAVDFASDALCSISQART